MDLSNIKISYSDIQKHIPLSWQEIKFAVDNNIIEKSSFVKHAVYILEEGIPGFDIVLELSILDMYDDVTPYVSKLIQLEERECEECIKSKWLYLILWHLYKNRNEYSNPLEIVEDIYCEFDYPQSITGFVRYMPSDEPDLGSYEKNEARMYKKWASYLEDEKLKFEKG